MKNKGLSILLILLFQTYVVCAQSDTLNVKSEPINSIFLFEGKKYPSWEESPMKGKEFLIRNNELERNTKDKNNAKGQNKSFLSGPSCPSFVNSLLIATGYDEGSTMPMSVSSGSVPDISWMLVGQPTTSNHNIPRPAFAIEIPKNSNNDPVWHAPSTNSKWISDHEVAQDTQKGKFSFEYEFCLESGFQNPVLDLDIRADNFFDIFLNGVNINCANQPCTYPLNNPDQPNNAPCGCDNTGNGNTFSTNISNPVNVIVNNPSLFSSSSVNVLRIDIYNSDSYKGLMVDGNLTTTGNSIKNYDCCAPKRTVSGFAWFDLDNDGTKDVAESYIANQLVIITDNNGYSNSQVTDVSGYYYFNALPGSGPYEVTVFPQSTWFVSIPSLTTQSVTVNPNQMIGNINFPMNECLNPKEIKIVPTNVTYCLGKPIGFNLTGDVSTASSISWDFGNGQTSTIRNPTAIYPNSGTYTISVIADYISGCGPIRETKTIVIADYVFCTSCDECIGSFAPEAGAKYVVSAWVKESDFLTKSTYTNAGIAFYFEGSNIQSVTYKASGPIIEGWQQIETEVDIPDGTSAINVELKNEGLGDVFFDDIRIFPFNANLKSFVYDPITMRLTAELDENNYATFYEYDEDGNLIRVKKETERGVKTIQETIKRIKQY